MSIVRTVLLSSLLFGCFAPVATGGNPGSAPKVFEDLIGGCSLSDHWQGMPESSPEAEKDHQEQIRDEEVSEHWRLEKGVLVSDGRGPSLVSKREFGNFELCVCWLTNSEGEGGVYLRGFPEVPILRMAYEAALQRGDGKGGPGDGSQAGAQLPAAVHHVRVGKWNHLFVRMVGQYATVILNGKTVAKNFVLEDFLHQERLVPAVGPIRLEPHSSEIRFRGLQVRELSHEEVVRHLACVRGGERGFNKIFNGENLEGWSGAKEAYEIVQEAVRCKNGMKGYLMTDAEYDNFVIRFEVLIPPGGNNGLGIHVPATGEIPAYDGIEIQVIDPTAPKHANIKDYQHHGSVYGLAPARQGYLRPVGQWNYEEIVVDKGNIQVFLNGFEIVNCNLEEVRSNPVDGEEHPGAYRTTGHIVLCGHDEAVQFRNIRIRQIED